MACPITNPFPFTVVVDNKTIQGCSNIPPNLNIPFPAKYDIVVKAQVNPGAQFLSPEILATTANQIAEKVKQQLVQQGHQVYSVDSSINLQKQEINVTVVASSPPVAVVAVAVAVAVLAVAVLLSLVYILSVKVTTSPATLAGWLVVVGGTVAVIGGLAALVYFIKKRKT